MLLRPVLMRLKPTPPQWTPYSASPQSFVAQLQGYTEMAEHFWTGKVEKSVSKLCQKCRSAGPKVLAVHIQPLRWDGRLFCLRPLSP